MTENEFVIPICLPWADDEENYLDGGRSGKLSVSCHTSCHSCRYSGNSGPITEVAGWGATTITGRKPATVLQVLTVNVTDAASCKEVYAERGGILGEKQICAGGEKGKVEIKHNKTHSLSISGISILSLIYTEAQSGS